MQFNYCSMCHINHNYHLWPLISWFWINIWLMHVSLQVLQESSYRHFDFSSLQCLHDPKCLFCTSFITVTVQHFSNITWPNIFVNMVSPDHTVYCIGFCFRCYCICRTPWFLNRSHNLIIKKACRYYNHRYYCWAGKSMLWRNRALHTIYPLYGS